MDGFSIALIAIAAVLIVFMFVSSRRRRRDAETMRAKIVPGVDVMTSHGIYGHLVSLDEEKNEAVIETTPGTRLRVHSQTIAKVVEEELPVVDDAADEAVADVEPAAIDPIVDADDVPEKPAPRPRKKPTE